MGWISDRHMKTGGSINSRPSNNGSNKGPLRLIVSRLYYGTHMFDRDKAVFECGHEGYVTIGSKRGRCTECGKTPNV